MVAWRQGRERRIQRARGGSSLRSELVPDGLAGANPSAQEAVGQLVAAVQVRRKFHGLALRERLPHRVRRSTSKGDKGLKVAVRAVLGVEAQRLDEPLQEDPGQQPARGKSRGVSIRDHALDAVRPPPVQDEAIALNVLVGVEGPRKLVRCEGSPGKPEQAHRGELLVEGPRTARVHRRSRPLPRIGADTAAVKKTRLEERQERSWSKASCKIPLREGALEDQAVGIERSEGRRRVVPSRTKS